MTPVHVTCEYAGWTPSSHRIARFTGTGSTGIGEGRDQGGLGCNTRAWSVARVLQRVLQAHGLSFCRSLACGSRFDSLVLESPLASPPPSSFLASSRFGAHMQLCEPAFEAVTRVNPSGTAHTRMHRGADKAQHRGTRAGAAATAAAAAAAAAARSAAGRITGAAASGGGCRC